MEFEWTIFKTFISVETSKALKTEVNGFGCPRGLLKHLTGTGWPEDFRD